MNKSSNKNMNNNMNLIINDMMKASGDIWKEFKNYCLTHDYEDKDFMYGIISIGDQLDDKYLNTPMHKLQVHLWAGLVDALCQSMKEKNEHI